MSRCITNVTVVDILQTTPFLDTAFLPMCWCLFPPHYTWFSSSCNMLKKEKRKQILVNLCWNYCFSMLCLPLTDVGKGRMTWLDISPRLISCTIPVHVMHSFPASWRYLSFALFSRSLPPLSDEIFLRGLTSPSCYKNNNKLRLVNFFLNSNLRKIIFKTNKWPTLAVPLALCSL